MKRRTRARSLTGVTLLLLAGMLLFWLLSMAALTLAAAEQVYERLFQQALRFGDYAEACFGLSGPGSAADGEAFLSAIRAGEAEAPAFPVYEAGRSGSAFSLTAIPEPVFQTAVLFADGAGWLLAAPAAGDQSYFSLFRLRPHENTGSVKPPDVSRIGFPKAFHHLFFHEICRIDYFFHNSSRSAIVGELVIASDIVPQIVRSRPFLLLKCFIRGSKWDIIEPNIIKTHMRKSSMDRR